MLKTVVPATLLSLFVATSALAEHKLLITSVPDPGQVETRVDFAYSRATAKNEFDEKIADEKTGAAVTVAAGVVDGLKISASLPYTFVQHREGEKIDGLEDMVLGARYSLTKSLLQLPFDVAVGIDWKLDSASSNPGKAGTGLNEYAPYLAISKNLHTVIPYFKYQPVFTVKKHEGETVHNLTLGAEIEFGHHYSLDVALKGAINEDRSTIRTSKDLELEIGPYINIVKNLYLLPSVAYKIIGDVKDEAGTRLLRNADEYKVGLGVYYLF